MRRSVVEAELKEPIYIEEKLAQMRASGRLDYRSKVLPTWCPGCGYFSIAEGLTSALTALRIPREDAVVVSGIGCASRFPFFMDTYGFHTLHGRALPVATGINLRVSYPARPRVAGGDGHQGCQRRPHGGRGRRRR
jgi:2-oxoglutarate ferredoxin oxidoreductase subunit beta